MACDDSLIPSCGSDCLITDGIVIKIWPSTVGGTLIAWELPSTLAVSGDAVYRVQFGRTPSNNDNTWEDVGNPDTNITQVVDYKYRDVGDDRYSYYRLEITDGDVKYLSQPYFSDVGVMSMAQRRLYNEIVRREQRRYRDRATPACIGYLIKLRRHGPPCPECTDPDTNQRYLEHCPVCFGGGYDRGYYKPIKCFYMDVGNYKRNVVVTENAGMTTEGNISSLKWLNIPNVDPGDIWVDANTDYRWEIGEITVVTKVASLPLICTAPGARLPLNDVAYTISLETL